ncbi:hypothetical protein BKA66DRAFT_448070 [Pyrenochaeta sp. MPI-SDFR-AT-0127]|nr:hypothetical protein BKA66DRAFT_448070 [Pyrenochaeta sp. MPI-SDFR-AT-0127]
MRFSQATLVAILAATVAAKPLMARDDVKAWDEYQKCCELRDQYEPHKVCKRPDDDKNPKYDDNDKWEKEDKDRKDKEKDKWEKGEKDRKDKEKDKHDKDEKNKWEKEEKDRKDRKKDKWEKEDDY